MIHIWLGASPSGRGSVRFLGVGMMNKGGEMHTASKRSSLRTCKRLRLRKMRTVPTDLLRPNSRKNMFGVSAMTGEREPDCGDRGLRYIRNENNSSFESFELAMTRVTGSVTPSTIAICLDRQGSTEYHEPLHKTQKERKVTSARHDFSSADGDLFDPRPEVGSETYIRQHCLSGGLWQGKRKR